MTRQFQFITISNPAGPVSAKSRKLAYSHALRQRHAKERQLRSQAYQLQRQKESRHTPDDAGFELQSRMLSYCNDPFSATGRNLTTQEYYLLDHYVKVIVPFSATHCGLFERPGHHQETILRDWVGLAVTDSNLLDTAILLGSCRNLMRKTPGDPRLMQTALLYKQKGLYTLRQAVGSPGVVSLTSFAQALALAFDEESSGQLNIARQHLAGVIAMVEQSGGIHALGITGLLEHIYTALVSYLGLGDKDLRARCWKNPGIYLR